LGLAALLPEFKDEAVLDGPMVGPMFVVLRLELSGTAELLTTLHGTVAVWLAVAPPPAGAGPAVTALGDRFNPPPSKVDKAGMLAFTIEQGEAIPE
jgi:hypothetical protein